MMNSEVFERIRGRVRAGTATPDDLRAARGVTGCRGEGLLLPAFAEGF